MLILLKHYYTFRLLKCFGFGVYGINKYVQLSCRGIILTEICSYILIKMVEGFEFINP